MAREKPTVLVAGDVTVDWFMYPVKASDKGENWRLHDALHSDVSPGGAALLTSFIQQSVEEDGIPATVLGPEFPKDRDIRSISPDEIIHSNAILDNFKNLANKKAEVLRIKNSLGYIGPSGDKPPSLTLSLASNESNAEIIVLDDAGNVFRKMEKLWPKALSSCEDSIIVHKMSFPLLEDKLWAKIGKKPRKNLIAIINASDLRKISGVRISKSLSWDRTAKDLARELQKSDALYSLHQYPYLVVLFGTEGAILYHRKEEKEDEVFIIFDPNLLEDSFASNIDGTMIGLTSIFTATLVKELSRFIIETEYLVKELKENYRYTIGAEEDPKIYVLNQQKELLVSFLKTGIKQGLANSRALLEIGYKINKRIKYPEMKEVLEKSGTYTYACSSFENSNSSISEDSQFWRILDNEALRFRQFAAREIVLKGEAQGLENVPICRFGDLEIIDRAEIESYSPIKELINEFLLNPKPKNPLCFAVFGPPGSGKSLGVKQIIKSIDSNEDRIKSISFNVSQFGDYQDLVNAFHKVRDIALSGKIPFVFFDEFDSDNGHPLGWLKYFLAPMQDGEFKEGDSVHPIGNAIFVFAGGTSHTFEDFVKNFHDSVSTANTGSCEAANTVFKDAKGPDFVSRLRGFINVMGPNRQHTKHDDDVFIIRRAKVLRVLLEKEQTASGLFNSKKELNIDDGVLRAILNVTSYKHGTRSMASLIQMSRLAGKSRFDLSALPIREQLDMHVDAAEFQFLMEKERYQSMLRLQDLPDPKETSYLKKERDIVDAVAMSIYKHYNCPDEKYGPYKNISFKKARDIAEDIPNILLAINNGIQKIKGKTPQIPDITGDEIETFARIEYERQYQNQMFDEFSDSKKGNVSNSSAKLSKIYSSEYYDQLTEEEKDKFREFVYSIPPILKDAGYEIYRMKKLQEITNPEIIKRLAWYLHDNYVKFRMRQGETHETNPSLVNFKDLPEDIKEANFDNIKKIPEKLSWIGYSIRRIQDDNQTEITLTENEVEKMAKREHDRWVWQKIMQGWTYKEGVKDFAKKTTPFIVPWHKLPDNIRINDFNTVRLIPKLLKEAGYEAYKPDNMKETK